MIAIITICSLNVKKENARAALAYLLLLLHWLLCIGSWAAFAADILSPEAFAERFAQGLRKALPSAIVTVKGAELVLKDPASGTNTSLVLENAYTDYRHDPARLDHLLTAYITAMRQARSAQATPRQDGGEPTGQKIDRARIVPVIKDRQWIDHNLNGLKARGVTAEGAHALTRTLFVYRNGGFRKFGKG